MADLKALSDAIIKGDQKTAVEITTAAINEGMAPGTILEDGLIAGMNVIGVRFKANEVYIPEVLISARAMKMAMEILEPKLAILDETDSGLDIDALKIVANGVNTLRKKENAIIVVTHYQRLLDYIVPDFVHVLYKGKIVKSGGKQLAHDLESQGYDWIKEENITELADV